MMILVGCQTPSGSRGVSDNIAEAKKRKVFVAEYTVPRNPYKINDSLQLTVKEAWVEEHWAHGKTEDETIFYPVTNYQLCINSEEKDMNGIGFDWTIGVDFVRNLRASGKNSLIGDFENVPPDTIEYQVQKGSELSDNYKKVIVGNFAVAKKK